MSDQFAAWTKLLDLAQTHKTKSALREAINASGIEIFETEPLSGYYRSAAVKDGPLLPVAIWREGEKLIVLRGNEPVNLELVWPYCVWYPIPYDWYEAATERGEKWPDEHVIAKVPASILNPEGEAAKNAEARARLDTIAGTLLPATQATTAEAAMSDEEAGRAALTKAKEAEGIKAQIDAALADKTHLDIKTEDGAAAAQSARSALNKMSGDADKRRLVLMHPYQSKADAIHETWMPVVKLAKGGADAIRDALRTWENVTKPALQRVQQAQQQQEAPVVEQPVAVPTATADRVVTPAHNEPPAVPPQSNVQQLTPAVSTGIIKGATGRAARVTEKKVATVNDYDALYAHVKAFPEVKQLLDRIAQRLVDAGNEVPGVTVNGLKDVS